MTNRPASVLFEEKGSAVEVKQHGQDHKLSVYDQTMLEIENGKLAELRLIRRILAEAYNLTDMTLKDAEG